MNLALVKKLWKTMQMDKAIGEGAALSWVQFLEMAFKDMPEPPSLGVSDEEAQEIVNWWNSKPFTQPAKADEVIATVEERIDAANKTPMPSKQEFQSQVPAAVSGRDAQTQDLETYGIDQSIYNELNTIFGFAPTEEDIFNWVASQPEDEQLEAQIQAQAYFNLMTGETILRPAFNDDGTAVLINGKQPLMPFAGHFKGTKVSDILDNYATSDEILQFQNFLTSNNLVPDNYFAESQGEMSEKLRASIMYVMNWADKNMHAVPGTELYESISAKDPVYFSESQNLYGEWDIHRNIFNEALKELAKKQESLDEVQEGEIAKKLAEEFIPPSKSALEDMVDAYFESKLGRSATKEELDEWSTNFADSYSIAFAQARSKAQQLQDTNFMQSQPEYLEIESRQKLAQEYGAEKVIDLSMFSTSTPQEIMAEQIEDEFGKQIDAVEEGRKVRKMQNDLVAYMFGG